MGFLYVKLCRALKVQEKACPRRAAYLQESIAL